MDIWYSSLTERVFMWKSKTAKWMKKWVKQFVWDKIDITNKFLFIVEQYFKVWTSRVIEQWEKSTMYISIENTKEAKEKLIESLKKDLTTL
jgi:hypothetical protein